MHAPTPPNMCNTITVHHEAIGLVTQAHSEDRRMVKPSIKMSSDRFINSISRELLKMTQVSEAADSKWQSNSVG